MSPTDMKLYESVKQRVYKRQPKHSAYRSGRVVQEYKKSFKKKYGSSRRPYSGNRSKSSLGRWFAEDWRNQRGEVGYKYKSDVYRPTRRITKKTPITFGELSKKEVSEARKIKYKKGRVKKFRKRTK